MNVGFGQRLKEAIKQADITQKYIAEELDISTTAMTNYIKGRIPDATILYNISKLLGVSMEWLLVGNDDDPKALDKTATSFNEKGKADEISIEIKGARALTESEVKCLDLFKQLEPLEQGIILGRMIEMVDKGQKKQDKRGRSSNYHNGEEAAAKEMA